MTTINDDMDATQTTIPLADPAALAVGYYTIDDENVQVLGVERRTEVGDKWTRIGGRHDKDADEPTSVLCVRGVGGSTAAPHDEGAALTRYYPDAPGTGGEGGGLPTGWTQDGETGAVDTGGQDITANLLTAVAGFVSQAASDFGGNDLGNVGNLTLTNGVISNQYDHSDWGNNRIENLGAPNSSDDAATKGYVDGVVATPNLEAVLTTGNDANGLTIENLLDPETAQQPATKGYVDGVGTFQSSTDVAVTQEGGTIVVVSGSKLVRWTQVGKLVVAHFFAEIDTGTTGAAANPHVAFADLPAAHVSYAGVEVGRNYGVIGGLGAENACILSAVSPLTLAVAELVALQDDDTLAAAIIYEAA